MNHRAFGPFIASPLGTKSISRLTRIGGVLRWRLLTGAIFMRVSFANSYIDRLFTEKDMPGLYDLITVMGRDKALPDEFWLFCEILSWSAFERCGVYQYYETVPRDKFEKISRTLDQFGLADLAEKYRYRMDISGWAKQGSRPRRVDC